jgi:peptidoglycan/LPS O-acetylase OafA/YrhL
MAKLPAHIPELDGLRGIAIALVFVYHCHPRLASLHLESVAEWGWIGVNLFFVLSGFLITSILADSRRDPHYFRNFYARRALRIWPVYVLLLVIYYFVLPLPYRDPTAAASFRNAPWLLYALLIQNLFTVKIPAAIGPTWSLAIEEQFYLAWAPAVRFLSAPFLIPLLVAVFIASPFLRMAGGRWFTPVHTVTHLDGLAIGSLIALSLRSFPLATAAWRRIGWALIVLSSAGFLITRTHTYAFTDSLLSLGFAGMLMAAIFAEGRGFYSAGLRLPPLRFLGRVGYSLYLFHILCFILLGNFAVVAVRFAVSVAVASLLWYGFESRILRLKRFFTTRHERAAAAF